MRKVTAVFSKTLTYLFLLIVAVFAVFPVIYILLGSFKSNTEFLSAALTCCRKSGFSPTMSRHGRLHGSARLR